MAAKKPEEACEHLLVSTTKGASKLISGMCLALLPEILKMPEDAVRTDSETRKIKRFCRCVETLVGKSGDEVSNSSAFDFLLQASNHAKTASRLA